MQNIILELVANAMDISVLTLLFSRRFMGKYNTKIPTLCFIVVGFILESLPLFFDISFYPTEIILIVLCIGYLHFFKQGTILHKLFWITISFVLIFAIAFTVMPLVSCIAKVDSDIIFNQLSFSKRALYLAIVNIIKFTLFSIMSMRPRKIYNNYSSMFICLLIPLISIISGIWIFNIFVYSELQAASDEIILLISVSFLIINICSFMLYEKIEKDAEKTFYLMAKENQYELMSRYIDQIKQTNKEIRVWQHDMKHHLTCLHTLNEKKDYVRAGEYLEKFTESVESSYLKVNSGNYLADAVLSSKFDKATSKGIKIESEASLPESLPINEVDFCSILSNILDNAIEACQKVESNPLISCNIMTIRNQLIISVKNSSDGKYKFQNGVYETQKKDGIHGIGLRHTQSIIDQYDGICTIDAGENKFKIEISIPLK